MKLRAYLTASVFAITAAVAPRAANAEVSPLDLVGPIAEYKLFIGENLEKLVNETKAFTDAIKAGDIEKAKKLYAPTRMNYEIVEPVAELFSDLDGSIDSRADDHEQAEKDPAFTGFHRLEYGLFSQNSTEGLKDFADKLQADVVELHKRITELTFPPEKVVGGAAALMEEVAATKISGEEDRYSHTDLWDFKANFDGSRKIFDLVRPLIEKDDGTFVAKVSGNFDTVDKTLSKYKTAEGYELYDKLTDDDRTVLAAAVNTLAEDLSTLRGKLGLN
ncbi:iron uptake system protein EfeO [Phyllobacterium sp. OV277]|jgi:iron uptake system component EfeO|uniref:iron uptake system protein EfeO n=1 Tax=Phyllobacterium sp. OV277 TaxID=1882772 RepID=UPI00088EC1E0|nr:iron uptake system protein EfeO [Phyllobacterium sp. OV277]SDP88529.1 iron uptake system component EfeO [Phyllobacterium sp. OV277]